MRYARNCVNVPGLAAASQAIGYRKVPTYRLKPMKGGDAKSVFLRLGLHPGIVFIGRLACSTNRARSHRQYSVDVEKAKKSDLFWRLGSRDRWEHEPRFDYEENQ
jgi:hypothetical protein